MSNSRMWYGHRKNSGAQEVNLLRPALCTCGARGAADCDYSPAGAMLTISDASL
jgi:hypothetical protein